MKPILLICLVFFGCLSLKAQVEGPTPGRLFSNSNLSGSSQSWISTGNAGASDDTYTSFGNLPGITGSYTDYLLITDFGFRLPAGVIVTGIKAEVECSDPGFRTSEYSVRIVKGGTIGTNEKAIGEAFALVDKKLPYGGSGDLWGETWDYLDINNSNFGIAIAVQRNAPDGTTDGRVDDVTITVYFNLVTLPVSLVSFTATKNNRSVQLNWTTASETSMDHYEAERSSNGIHFYSLATIPSRNQQATSYSHTDKSPPTGIIYYRLKMEGAAGYKKYSPVLSVHFDKQAAISLSPCPWTKGSDLIINNPGKEVLRLQFYNALGQMISTMITSSDKVATDNLINKEGKFYYNVFNARNELLGSGTLIIQ